MFRSFVLLVRAKFVIQSVFYIHLLSVSPTGRLYGRSLRMFQKRNVLSEIWDHEIDGYFQFKDEKQSVFFEGPSDTAQSTVSISIIKVKQLILHGTRVAACSKIKYATHYDTL